LGKDLILADLIRGLLRNGAEERRKTVVILLAPFFERMVMALRTLEPLSKEQLGSVLHLDRGVLGLSIPHDRWIRIHVATGGEDRANEAVVGDILCNAVPYPAMEGKIAARILGIVSLVAQQGAPFPREVVSILI